MPIRRVQLSVSRRQLVAVAGVAAILLVAVVPQAFTLRPEYYRRFPELADRIEHWRTSTHSKVRCIECHVEPGVAGFVTYGVRSIPAFYSQLILGSHSSGLLSAPSRAACQRCHTTYRTVAPSGDLLIPHRAHVVVLKMECVTCHENLVHVPNRRGFNRPEMERCLELCHDGERATNECVKCHTRKNAPASHERPEWLRVHGERARTDDCGRCHDWTPDYCRECHERRPASHVGNWKKGHAVVAKVRATGCPVCHGKDFCKECH